MNYGAENIKILSNVNQAILLFTILHFTSEYRSQLAFPVF